LIHFRNYDAQEILQILTDRARSGLTGYSRAQLAEIAALTSRFTNSDVRVAIKTLYYSALDPDMALRELFDRARRDVVADLLADLNDRALLMLRAAADGRDPFVKSIYERYRRLSAQKHDEPFSYVHFYANLSYLQSIGLIMLISTKVGRTYTNRIQLLFDLELLDRVWEVRFG
jgi:Cdc6-like AAA superfamily ATPase